MAVGGAVQRVEEERRLAAVHDHVDVPATKGLHLADYGRAVAEDPADVGALIAGVAQLLVRGPIALVAVL